MNCDFCGEPLNTGYVEMSRPFTGEPLRACAIDCPGIPLAATSRGGDRAEVSTDPGGPVRLRPRPVRVHGKYRIPGKTYTPPPPFPWDAA